MAEAPTEGPLDASTLIQNGWFIEKNSQWPGKACAIEVKEVLFHKKTDFQDLMVFESTHWGKVLILDGVIQLTERDEIAYHEMLVHLPLFAHPDPKQVLIIGGGDGGCLREAVKHSCIEHTTMCEIDVGVVEASKQFFPKISSAFGHPKTTLKICDAVAFVAAEKDETFDVIIVDSSDPVGPAELLFSPQFYVNAHRILKPGGIICAQGECLWEHADLIETLVKQNGAPFATAEYATLQVPTYPSGQIGAFLARKAGGAAVGVSCRQLQRPVPEDMELSYYSAELHAASFAVPAFIARRLGFSDGAKRAKSFASTLRWESS